MKFLEDLAQRRRFGMKPGLQTITHLMAKLGNPEKKLRAIHIAGTNGKGATSAIIDAALNEAGFSSGRYTSPHLVKINERFFINGGLASDEDLERVASTVTKAANDIKDLTFFEALTAMAFKFYADKKTDFLVLETGLGGRFDATNICSPVITVITKIGLDHCDWLGDTIEKITVEKAGIIKKGAAVVLGKNEPKVVEIIRKTAEERGVPFYYAPDLIKDTEIPANFQLKGAFNRENAITALAALKVLFPVTYFFPKEVIWPGRFHEVGRFIIDGAHNPPAAKALVQSLAEDVELVVGFCGDKDIDSVINILKPRIKKAYTVKTVNPRSVDAQVLSAKIRTLGIEATAMPTLKAALQASRGRTLICGSLFLAGEAIVELGVYPWGGVRFDENEKLSAI